MGSHTLWQRLKAECFAYVDIDCSYLSSFSHAPHKLYTLASCASWHLKSTPLPLAEMEHVMKR